MYSLWRQNALGAQTSRSSRQMAISSRRSCHPWLRLEGGVDDGCRGSHGVHVRRRAPLALDGPGHRVRAERRASVQLAPGYVAMDEAHHGKLLLLEVKGRSVGSSAIDRARELRCARQGFSSRCSLRVLFNGILPKTE